MFVSLYEFSFVNKSLHKFSDGSIYSSFDLESYSPLYIELILLIMFYLTKSIILNLGEASIILGSDEWYKLSFSISSGFIF